MKEEELGYKCVKCLKSFPFRQMKENFLKCDNGSVQITYICPGCREKEILKLNSGAS